MVCARAQLGNAAVTATMGGLARGAEPRLSAWTAQMMVAGQNLVGNQAIANQATALAPATPVTPTTAVPTPAGLAPGPPAPRKPPPAKPAARKTGAQPATAPDKQDLAKDKTPEERPEKGAKKDKGAGPRSPGADPKFQALRKDVDRKKKTIGAAHPPAVAEAGAAQEAAEAPADDQEARGKAAHAEDMDAARPKEFDKQKFIQAVKKAIADKAPKNLDEADKFRESGKAEEVKTEVQGKVGEGKDASAQEIAETTAAQPQPAPDAKRVVPLAGDKVPGKPGTPNPAQAAPDTLPASATDMSAGPDQVDRQMADAQVTERQLSFKNSREPQFDKAVKEKKTMEAHSEAAPKKLRADEAGELKQVKNTAAAQGSAAMAGIHATRVTTGQQVGTGKKGAKRTDEDKRREVTDLLQKVFDQTKCDVEKILTDLDKKVDDQFTTKEKRARDRFTREHEEGMERYKDERYGGPLGWARWTRDLFAGLPEEANRIYEHARDNYLAAMDQIITEIADTVEAELKRAKDRIAAGRKELKTAVDKLPADLKAIGREAATEFEGKFDELKDTVNDKGTELVDTLATKYTDAVKAVDDEIAKEKEKNKGLVAKAADAIGGAIKSIIELGRMLMGVLRKAVSAIGAILADPIGFLGNLVTGVGGGLKLFMRNAGRHLQGGVLAWLLGTGGAMGLQLPATFDILGILTLIATILGLSWPNIRARLARRVPQQALVAAETAVPLVAQVRRRGVMGMWDDLKTRVGDLKKELIGNLVSFLLPTIIIAGITWIVSLFNPASAFIRACKMIIDIVRFIVTNARQIIEFVNAVLDAVIAIARGGTGGVPALVERALARSIPVLIGALAALLGIGGIAGKVKQVFQKIARPVNRAIDRVIDKIVGLVKKLWAKLKARRGRPARARRPGRPDRPQRPGRPRRPGDRVSRRDNTPDGQRRRLRAAVTAGVRAVNRLSGHAVGRPLIEPLLTAIRIRYGLSVLRPVEQSGRWAVYGVINPEMTGPTSKKADGGDNPNFRADAKKFEEVLGAKAAVHPAATSALAGMAAKVKKYLIKATGSWEHANTALHALIKKIAATNVELATRAGSVVDLAAVQAEADEAARQVMLMKPVMAVFDEGTLTERFTHIISFYSNVLGADLVDPERFRANVKGWVIAADLDLGRLRNLARAVRRPGRRSVRGAMAPVPRGSDVELQPWTRIRRDASESREVGLRADELGLPMSPREVAQQRTLQEDWDPDLHALKWEAGSKEWRIREDGEFATNRVLGRRAQDWVRAMQALDIPLAAGPSGTTNVMMNVAVAFRAGRYDTRLASIGFLVGARHHSLVEVLAAAEPFGCSYTKGRRMYRNIKPIDTATLRTYGNGKFPDEATAPRKGGAS
ncbi:HPC2 multi-domain protein [Spongiactinospora rosea]|uniref:HPC2 multi-domain protein n=1 Tax=Spongiactinospora rosea TaxID=2248750 RepID=A0A366LMN6_9ACTN|nr:HPC2 multi-domain protein [Spongiactinospora rosea]